MDTEQLSPVDQAKHCISKGVSFVLHGGAGSGKTESLKDLLEFMQIEKPEAKVACITHTNVAVDEMKDRTGEMYQISTIHSFFYQLIMNYKKNIKTVIHELYTLSPMERSIQSEDVSEVDYKKNEYARYKSLYNKFANKLYLMENKIFPKVPGKVNYDKDPEKYNKKINIHIEELNQKIKKKVNDIDCATIEYNKTKFNDLNKVSFGHDGLLEIVKLLFDTYPMFKKIISDRYDYIFIDEYQDTKSSIIEAFISMTEVENKFTIGLFGDSMQSIFKEGIGNVATYIESGALYSIQKKDNYRCSYEVLELINTLRLDDVVQEVALAKSSNGQIEDEDTRHGEVKIFYSIYESKPNVRSLPEDKEAYLSAVESLIEIAQKETLNAKTLLLTNKAIAEKEGFLCLYNIFNDRYSTEVTDRMDDFLSKSGVTELCELSYNYMAKKYNEVVVKIKNTGFDIKNMNDKVRLQKAFSSFIETDRSLFDAINFAIDSKLIKQPDSLKYMLKSNERFMLELKQDSIYQDFRIHYNSGGNTYARIAKLMRLESEGEFNDLVKRYKKEVFITDIFSSDTNFSDAMCYFKYINENSSNITMHKTKGSSLDSVIVVMEEFFWTSEYDFSLLHLEGDFNQRKKDNSQKLIYVACSRARKNLTCVKLIKPEEEESFCAKFPKAEKKII